MCHPVVPTVDKAFTTRVWRSFQRPFSENSSVEHGGAEPAPVSVRFAALSIAGSKVAEAGQVLGLRPGRAMNQLVAEQAVQVFLCHIFSPFVRAAKRGKPHQPGTRVHIPPARTTCSYTRRYCRRISVAKGTTVSGTEALGRRIACPEGTGGRCSSVPNSGASSTPAPIETKRFCSHSTSMSLC